MQPTIAILCRLQDQNLRLTSALEESELFEVKSFQDGAELVAWARERTTPVTALFSDDVGPEFLQLLRGIPCVESSLVFDLTAHSGRVPVPLSAALSELADSVVVKPFLLSAFEEKVNGLVKSRQRKKMSALLVDETGEARAFICRALSECGFLTVLDAQDTEAAREVLEKNPDGIALVVVCCEMPTNDGLAFLNHLKTEPRLARVPFLLITSQRSLEIAREAQASRQSVTRHFSLAKSGDELRAQVAAVEESLLHHGKVAAFFREAAVFVARGAVKHAVEILEHAVKIFPREAALLEKLGDLHAGDFEDPGYLDKAIDAYRRSIRERPSARSAVLKCGDLLQRLERIDDMIRLYREFLVVSVFDSTVRTRLAKLFIQRGDYGAAGVELRRTLSLDPGQKEARMLFQMAQSLGQPARPFPARANSKR